MSDAVHDHEAHRRDAERGASAPGPPSAGGATDGLDALLDSWVSRYCPECSSRYATSADSCPKDGTHLRDLSIDFTSDASATPPGTDTTTPPPPPSHRPDDRPLPEVFGDKWVLVLERGGGSFGRFFAGEHKILGMQVGIKLLRRRFTASSATRRLFHQEAMRLSRLDHPNIVKILDYGEEGEQPYLVMEYLSGKPLHRFLEKDALSLDDKIEIMRQTAVALIAAHHGIGGAAPLVHLDLKPEHIFIEKIDDRWRVKVIDFGIAEIVSARDTADAAAGGEPGPRHYAGTLPYMAPERWRGVIDPRCDIYSMGVILYELIAGGKPFEAASRDAWRSAHETAAPPPPSVRRQGPRTSALRELDRIAMWCLEKDPARRPQRAEDLAAAFRRWQTRPRRNLARRLAGAAIVPVLVALLAAGLFFWRPWEKITVPPDAERGVGELTRVWLSASVPRFVREGSAAGLRIAPAGRDRDFEEFPLGAVGPNGALRAPTPSGGEIREKLEKPLLGEPLLEKAVAHIFVLDRLGYTRLSDPFEIAIDCEPPQVLRINDSDIDRGGAVPLLIPLGGDGKEVSVRITAGEPLDDAACFLNQRKGTPSHDRKTMTFNVSVGAPLLDIRLADRCGNTTHTVIENLKWIPEHGKGPVIAHFEVVGPGAAEKPLHGRNCPARLRATREGAHVTFAYTIDYPRKCRIDVRPIRPPVELAAGEGSFGIDEQELFQLAGERTYVDLDLSVIDDLDATLGVPDPLTASKPCRVFFEPQLEKEVLPADDQLTSDPAITVQVVARGPRLAQVTIDGAPVEGNGGKFAREVPVAPAGTTTVHVKIVRACGEAYEELRRYRRAPIDRTTYVFPLDALRLRFEFFTYTDPDTDDPEKLWVLDGDSWRGFLDAFCPAASRPGFSVEEARDAARVLTEELRRRALLPGDGSVAELPIERQVRALWQAKRLPPAGLEWVAGGQGEHLLLARKTGADSLKLENAKPSEPMRDAMFRVVIRDRDGLALSPASAIEAVRAEGGKR